jgi:RHS repeat-associated protein
VVNGGNTYVYRYDGLGNRVARIENGVEKRYVGGLAETDASGNITAYYVYGLGLISKITPSGQAYYYHYDGVGSTIGMSDSLGNIVNKYAYDAFGKVLSQEEAVENPFKYVGQFGVMDEENGLLYMRARYYDPETGRFISKDPIGFAGGDINLYSYVQNNPINFVDPKGEIIQVLIPYAPYVIGVGLGAWGLWWLWNALHPPSLQQAPCEIKKDKIPGEVDAPGSPGMPRNFPPYEPPPPPPPPIGGR